MENLNCFRNAKELENSDYYKDKINILHTVGGAVFKNCQTSEDFDNATVAMRKITLSQMGATIAKTAQMDPIKFALQSEKLK